MTTVVTRTSGVVRVERSDTPGAPTAVSVTTGVKVFRDGRGPAGVQGPPGNNIIIQEPPDPGDSLILALENAMV